MIRLTTFIIFLSSATASPTPNFEPTENLKEQQQIVERETIPTAPSNKLLPPPTFTTAIPFSDPKNQTIETIESSTVATTSSNPTTEPSTALSKSESTSRSPPKLSSATSTTPDSPPEDPEAKTISVSPPLVSSNIIRTDEQIIRADLLTSRSIEVPQNTDDKENVISSISIRETNTSAASAASPMESARNETWPAALEDISWTNFTFSDILSEVLFPFVAYTPEFFFPTIFGHDIPIFAPEVRPLAVDLDVEYTPLIGDVYTETYSKKIL